jgi:hypothetical protein
MGLVMTFRIERIVTVVAIVAGISTGVALPVEAANYATFNAARYKAASRASAVSLNPQPLPPKVLNSIGAKTKISSGVNPDG